MDLLHHKLLKFVLLLGVVAKVAAVENLHSETWTASYAPLSKSSGEMTMYKKRMGMVKMSSYASGKGNQGSKSGKGGSESLKGADMKHHHTMDETKKTGVSVKVSSSARSKIYPEKKSMDPSKSLKSSKKMISTKESMKKVSLSSKKSTAKSAMKMKMMMNGKGKGKGKGKGVPALPSFVPSVVPSAPPLTENPTSVPTSEPTTAAPTTTAPTASPTMSPTLPEEPPLFCFDPDNEVCGPPVWPEIPTPEENECGGRRQSPIQFESSDPCEPVEYIFNSGTCTYGELEYAMNNHQIAFIYPDSCTPPSVHVGDLTYAAESWSFSLGTGHQIDDDPTFGAVEIFHSLVEGDSFAEPFKIIGLGIVRGASDSFIDRVINGFVGDFFQTAEDCNRSREPTFEGTSAPNEIANPYVMLPENPSFYQYLGSRTKPPCQEDVFWSFLSDYTTIDDSEADTISRLILDWINPESCRFGTAADPETGSTTRPPITPGRRPISFAGACA
uniref:carbonic anhydrase n=1 Tax=Amphora coffeiformis TaxID=265554 RepID=A0A7S3KZC9_9STRA|mmetsp:Transcript_9140/g.18389  ORF Transcript_9140/g.18389 Transcript_9140/m.18389 type:complete len:500 (+) Transcript_9140:197-1696(+)